MTANESLKGIQNLPLVKRKVIFWVVIIIFGLILFAFWVWTVQQKIRTLPKEKIFQEMNLPKLEKDIKNLPKLELPKFNIEEDLKKIEEQRNETQSSTNP